MPIVSTQTAAAALLVAAGAVLASLWALEPWDIAAITIAPVLGGVSLLLFLVNRARTAN